MKKEYISPEIEIQKFSFESILAGGGTDDFDMQNDSNPENFANIFGSEDDLTQQ